MRAALAFVDEPAASRAANDNAPSRQRGNLISDGSRNFAYDYENRLLSVSGAASLTLTYDPLGRLRQTTASSVTTDFLYDGDRLSAEYNNGGTVLRRYVHGPGVDEPITWYEGSGTTDRRYLITDHQGSVIAENGAATVRYSYGPYGEPNAWSGSRFRYTGQIALPEVSLYHYKARVYDPVLGRFLQTDPVGYEDDLNLYAYVRNDPLNRADPTGRYQCQLANCNDFNQAQSAAASRMESAANRLNSAAGELNQAGGNVSQISPAGQATVQAFQQSFGTHADPAAAMTTAAGNFSAGATALRDTTSGTRTATEDPTPTAGVPGSTPVGGNDIQITSSQFNNLSSGQQRWVAGHESLHGETGMRDVRDSTGGRFYQHDSDTARNPSTLANQAPASAINNPDNYMCFAMGGC